MTMQIPLGKTLHVPSLSGDAVGLKPAFVDGNSDGGLTVIFDGQTVMNNVSFAPNGQSGNVSAGPGPSGSATMSNGGSFTYSSQIVINGGQPYVVISANHATTVGKHTLGVVQTNGACEPDQYSREQCISNTQGYVLAEGQATLNLGPGNNGSTALYLQGVMQSAYLCDAACDGQVGNPDPNGNFDITVFIADEAGDVINQQTLPSSQLVPYDNGSYQIVETDNQGIVTINQPSLSYNAPGNAIASGPYGENISITCNKMGTATVAAELLPTDPSSGGVSGFTYTSQNYPQAGSLLSAVGADEYFGNTLSVDCTATGSVTIE
jgi:hypothetical protein